MFPKRSMLDFTVLDEYAKMFEGCDWISVKNLIAEHPLPPRESRLRRKFLDGFLKNGWTIYDTITIIPTTSSLPDGLLDVYREGIEDFLERVGLIPHVVISSCLPAVEQYLAYNKKAKPRGVEISFPRFKSYAPLIVKKNISITEELRRYGPHYETAPPIFRVDYPPTYLVFVDDADFIANEADRVAGKTDCGNGMAILLDRPFSRGRISDGHLIALGPEEMVAYARKLAGHETYHLVDDAMEMDGGHAAKFLPEDKNCLGYSIFQLTATLCNGCSEEIQALWYGAQLRTGKKYLQPLILKR